MGVLVEDEVPMISTGEPQAVDLSSGMVCLDGSGRW